MFSCDWLVFKNCDHAFPRYVNDLDDDGIFGQNYCIKKNDRMQSNIVIYNASDHITRQRTNDTAYPQK